MGWPVGARCCSAAGNPCACRCCIALAGTLLDICGSFMLLATCCYCAAELFAARTVIQALHWWRLSRQGLVAGSVSRQAAAWCAGVLLAPCLAPECLVWRRMVLPLGCATTYCTFEVRTLLYGRDNAVGQVARYRRSTDHQTPFTSSSSSCRRQAQAHP